MRLYGLLGLGSFLLSWGLGVLSVPTCLIGATYGIYWPTIVLITYYFYRSVYPLKRWKQMKGKDGWFTLNANPYCKSQRIVFDEGASAPAPASTWQKRCVTLHDDY